MRLVDSLRILLCGLITGITWYALDAVLLSVFAPSFVTWTQTVPTPHRGASDFAIDLAMGIWAIWLYSALRHRRGSGTRTAVTTGLAWWIMKTLQSAKWASLGLIPLSLTTMPLLITLLAAVAAVLLGGQLFDRTAPPLSRQPTTIGAEATSAREST